MPLSLTTIEQLFLGISDETTFGVLEPGQTWKALRFKGRAPVPTMKSAEQPTESAGFWHGTVDTGRTDGEFSFDYDVRGKALGAVDECGLLLLYLFGKVHNPGTWNSTLDKPIQGLVSGAPADPTTSVWYLTTPSGIVVTDEGALLAVKDGDDNWQIRVLTEVVVNSGGSGYDKITVTPKVPTAPAVGYHMNAIKTFYFDGAINHQSFQMLARTQETVGSGGLFLGCHATGAFKFDPKSDVPFVNISFKVRYASSSRVLASGVVPETDDNQKPISLTLKAPLHFAAYSTPITVRDSTLKLKRYDTFEFDLAHEISDVVSGGAEANGIADHRNVNPKGATMKGSFTTPDWEPGWLSSFEANTNDDFDCLIQCGSSITTGMFAMYFPRVVVSSRPEEADLKGIKGLKIPFHCVENTSYTSAAPNAVDTSIVRVGIMG